MIRKKDQKTKYRDSNRIKQNFIRRKKKKHTYMIRKRNYINVERQKERKKERKKI